MRSGSRCLVASAFAFLSIATVLAQTYRSELQLGVEAYRNSHYEEAIQHFKKAIELDSSQVNAHMYLATAYASQYIPGVDTPDNKTLAQGAIEEYWSVLGMDGPLESKFNSSKGIAYLYLNMKQYPEAKEYYQKASGFNPKDPEPYYSIGVIDWTQTYQPRMEARANLGLGPGFHLNAKNPEQKKACDELWIKNQSIIEDGMDNLNKAIELRPDYDDAMAYMNLMYREKADLECDNPVAREEDLKTADRWVDKTLATKKAKAEKVGQPIDHPSPGGAPAPQ
jgi:tetratricopeptide (TPR) repeat protein